MKAPADAASPPAWPERPPRLAGGFSRPLDGFAECGDTFVVERSPGGELLVAVVDGLGHGAEAATAALAAAGAIRETLDLPVGEILRHCDRALQPTRGAAVGVLKLDEDGRGEFCGIGNIEVQGLEGAAPGLFCLAGIVGHNLRTVRTMPFTMRPGDIYCLHSDGVSSRGDLRGSLPGAPEAVARRIVESWGRRHDDATAVVLGYGAGARLLPETGTTDAPARGPQAARRRVGPDRCREPRAERPRSMNSIQ
jgi:Stage II sporulation protein E (SpoIIE)